ncbi:MAG: Rpn family recombination-promoting nuclease/putative transposase, partial [Sediminibacterium sp.]|nr:Rpn family recombination-promoting nuclease/putative transposase [Sediminibacterium sp.]
MTFVDIQNDIAFRKIFGNEHKKIILISFLNAVLKRNDTNAIIDIEFKNTFQLPIIQNLKASILDIKVTDKNNTSYIVEMQVSEPAGIDKRLLYYTSKAYAQQIDIGDDYIKLKPIIFIGIFNFSFTKTNKYYSHHAICDVESQERVLHDIDYFFIELPNFTKQAHELEDVMDKWIYFIKNAKELEVIPENVEDKGLLEAYHNANKFNWTKEELIAYEYAAMREQDERGIISLAEKRAKESGKIEGKIEGK